MKMLNRSRHHPPELLSNTRGASAIEFALIAPLLIALLFGVAELASYTSAAMSMNRAVRAGSQYVMNGGKEQSVVEKIVMKSWSDLPANASVTVSSDCLCGGTAITCSTTSCADGSRPEIYMTLVAHATVDGNLKSYTRKVERRVRIH